jgi:hypothetical protein
MRLKGGSPARLSWIAETVLGTLRALPAEATALQLSGRCFLPLRDVVDALDELAQRGLVEPVGRRWRLSDAKRAGGRGDALADPPAATGRFSREGERMLDVGDGLGQ